ncbi:dehydratase [Azospirillum sp. TSH58]|uniref:MaoC family dehydratase n=1 Tax=Azospirillum sp. TSH58 TaxID=664962 RepID=UPI000D6015B8|nr:MaoC family dehydratase [Azospirillum sp. TSH58]AWJ84778.1 dehydratase [Azospirillum sp. TSH58]PWC68705.1 dehydratase [Azospirillum sp. TSH58]
MRYLDDLTAGDRFTGGPVTVTEEDIVAFARQFDPQPFHLDPEAARDSVFGGLAASGWHTAGLTMRMIVTGDGALAGGFVGMGVEDIRWPKPTRPGDVLRIESEILEVRVSAKRPDRGIARVRTTTLNQDGEIVQQMTANLLVPCRPGAGRS